MALNASTVKNPVQRELLDPASYPARVVQVIDLGLQPQPDYKGQSKQPRYEILLTYEFLDEFLKDDDGNDIADKPRWISERMGLSSLKADNARSTKRMKALDPTNKFEGDFAKLIDTPCMVTIIHNPSKKTPGIVYENVAGLSSMRPKEAAKASQLVNKPKVFDLDNPDLDVFNDLPEWVQNLITSNLQFEGSKLSKLLVGRTATAKAEAPVDSDVDEFEDLDDEIPF